MNNTYTTSDSKIILTVVPMDPQYFAIGSKAYRCRVELNCGHKVTLWGYHHSEVSKGEQAACPKCS